MLAVSKSLDSVRDIVSFIKKNGKWPKNTDNINLKPPQYTNANTNTIMHVYHEHTYPNMDKENVNLLLQTELKD